MGGGRERGGRVEHQAVQAAKRHDRNCPDPAFTLLTLLSIRKRVFSLPIGGVGSFGNRVNSKLDGDERHQRDSVSRGNLSLC